jgi:hypothetical protein
MMELREIILLAGGISLGFGLGLMVYVIHRLRETRQVRWLRKSGKRYEDIISRIDKQQNAMQSRVDEISELANTYRVSK